MRNNLWLIFPLCYTLFITVFNGIKFGSNIINNYGGSAMNWTDFIGFGGSVLCAIATIVGAFIAVKRGSKQTTEDIINSIKESVTKTESWVGDPKSGVLADTGLIVNTTERIDKRTETLAQAIPKDLAVLAENTRHSLHAIEKSRDEHRSAEMILADVQRVITERQDGRDKIIELQRQNDLLTERIERLERQNHQLQREVERYEEREEEIER